MANDFQKIFKLYEDTQTYHRRGTQTSYTPDEAPQGLGYTKGALPTMGPSHNQPGTSAPNIYTSDEEHQKVDLDTLREIIKKEIINAEKDGQQYTILVLSKILKLI